MARRIQLERVANKSYKRVSKYLNGKFEETAFLKMNGHACVGACPNEVVLFDCCAPRVLEVKCSMHLSKFKTVYLARSVDTPSLRRRKKP